jgi:hypothetical protein
MRLIAFSLLATALAACSPQPAPEPEALAQRAPVAPAPSEQLATVGSPTSGARVTSPLRVSGVAPANWYFENQFPVRLLDAHGAVIAEAPAHPDVSWTENAEPKVFALDVPFQVTTETAAILVLQEDMPGEGEAPREVRIPVVLLPTP